MKQILGDFGSLELPWGKKVIVVLERIDELKPSICGLMVGLLLRIERIEPIFNGLNCTCLSGVWTMKASSVSES
jgi:hypothetical protein